MPEIIVTGQNESGKSSEEWMFRTAIIDTEQNRHECLFCRMSHAEYQILRIFNPVERSVFCEKDKNEEDTIKVILIKYDLTDHWETVKYL